MMCKPAKNDEPFIERTSLLQQQEQHSSENGGYNNNNNNNIRRSRLSPTPSTEMLIKNMDDSMYKTTTFTTALIFLGFHGRFYSNAEDRFTIVTEISIHPMLLYGFFLPCIALGMVTLLSRWKIVTNFIQQKISNSTKNRLKSCGSYANFSSLKKVSSVDRLKNLSRNLLNSLDSCSLLLQAITRKECFARLDYIERLSINDIAMLFRYASDVNLIDFDKSKFLSEQTKIVRGVVTAMDMAVKVSRGCLTEGTKTTEAERGEGDIDALYFVAATRIFAEWRNMRLVPKGYQRYAVGLSLAYRDVLQNLEKIERGIHNYLRYYQALDRSNNIKPIPSPTLRQLLKYELDTKLHKKLPYLGEKSAASGLLWTKRQLHYQVATLNNSLEVPHCYPTAKEAASDAYRIVYDEYHGWAVKKIFSHSFGGSPPLEEIWLYLDPPKDMPENTKTSRKGKQTAIEPSFEVPPERTLSEFSDASSQGSKTKDDNELLMALENFNHGVAEKWGDLLRLFNCGGKEKNKKDNNLILSSESHFNLSELASSLSITSSDSIHSRSPTPTSTTVPTNPIHKSKQDTEDFIREVSPMIADLTEMIEEFNMNDPSRV